MNQGSRSRSRAEQRRRQRQAASKAAQRGPRQSRWWLWLGGGLVIVAIIVVAVAVSRGKSASSAAPAGTAVFPENNHTHTTAAVHYDRVPPAGGPHNPTPQNCGVYDQPVTNENAVHSLEHGAVWITYQPSLGLGEVDRLRQLATSQYRGPQRYILLSPYPGLPSPVVASAWGAQLRLDSANDPRLGAFIDHFAGGGQGGEPGAPCSGGVGTPMQ